MEPSFSVDKRLKAAAESGDIDMLYSLIGEDPYALDYIERIPFVDTPLHIAASVGHAEFAMETMLLKSSFSRKLNQDGFTPLHLATLKGQTEMVDRLLDADSDLVRVHGKEGKTPLHCAAEKGDIDLLKRFLLSCPSSIQDVTNRSETALHIAVKSKKCKAFCLLVGRLRTDVDKGSAIQERQTLNKKNFMGDTALHIAVKTHQPEVVEVLINNQVKLDVKNSHNMTALEILELDDSQSQVNNREAQEKIKRMLHRAGASKCSSFFWWKSSTSLTNYVTSKLSIIEGVSNASPAPTSSNLSAVNQESDIAILEGQPQRNNVKANDLLPNKFLKVRHPLEGWVIDITRGRNNLSEDSRNMMLVALVLIATVGYQGILSPPGGLSQEDNNSTTTHKSVSLFHPPGIAVMGNWNFLVFMLSNSLALALTANAIIFLVLPDRLESRWWVYTRNLLAIFTALCYLISLLTISPNALLFALAIAIPAIAFLLIPSAYGVIKRNLELRTEDLMSPDNITYVLTDIF